jgi:ankyrin repeat protein
MEPKSHLVRLPEESLFVLVMSSDLNTLLRLSETSKELNNFLHEPYVLEQISIKNEIPVAKSLKEAKEYSKLDLYERLEVAIDNEDLISEMRMIKVAYGNYNQLMKRAASVGNIEIVELMLEAGATNYNETMIIAIFRGDIKIVELMLEAGANNYDEALSAASFIQNLEIMNLISKWNDSQ